MELRNQLTQRVLKLRKHLNKWLLKTLKKERKMNKTPKKLKLIKLQNKRNFNKKSKSINSLRNAKTTKTMQPPKSSLVNTATPSKFTSKELIHWKVQSKTSHYGSKN